MNIDTAALANFLNPTAQTSTSTEQKQQRPECTLWGNIGICLQITDENGESHERFVSLPYGIDLSNMPKRKTGSKESEYNKLLQSSNQLLDMIRAEAKDLKAGEKKILSNLTLQILVPDTKTETSTEGGLLDGISLS